MLLKREDEFVEFKESLSQLSRALESAVAMINKSGVCTIYFGIKDDGTVIGVDLGNKTLKDISHTIFEQIKPTIIPKISEALIIPIFSAILSNVKLDSILSFSS